MLQWVCYIIISLYLKLSLLYIYLLISTNFADYLTLCNEMPVDATVDIYNFVLGQFLRVQMLLRSLSAIKYQ